MQQTKGARLKDRKGAVLQPLSEVDMPKQSSNQNIAGLKDDNVGGRTSFKPRQLLAASEITLETIEGNLGRCLGFLRQRYKASTATATGSRVSPTWLHSSWKQPVAEADQDLYCDHSVATPLLTKPRPTFCRPGFE